jgi:acyl-CoA thioester hydrolase
MKTELLTKKEFRIEFYDVDSMNVAWHGNYVKYFEIGRCALLDDIGFGYKEMALSGYIWPVVDLRIKYIKPLRFGQTAVIIAELKEYLNRIRIKYTIRDKESSQRITIGESIQMAVNISSGESCLISPEVLTEAVEARLQELR